MLAMGALYGVMRIIGAVRLWRNKMWGLALSVINCVITMALMIFMLPAEIMDGLLACSALVLILTQYFEDKEIIRKQQKSRKYSSRHKIGGLWKAGAERKARCREKIL